MTNQQTKALEVLTRCGHFSGREAGELIDQLDSGELEQLHKMFDALMAAESLAADKAKQPGKKRPQLTPAEKQAVADASAVGEQFRAWRDQVEDRLRPPPQDEPAAEAIPSPETPSAATTPSEPAAEAIPSPETPSAATTPSEPARIDVDAPAAVPQGTPPETDRVVVTVEPLRSTATLSTADGTLVGTGEP